MAPAGGSENKSASKLILVVGWAFFLFVLGCFFCSCRTEVSIPFLAVGQGSFFAPRAGHVHFDVLHVVPIPVIAG